MITSSFADNYASQTGGAIYLKCESSACLSKIEGTEFTNNKAGLQGGAIYYEGLRPINIDANYYKNNTSG